MAAVVALGVVGAGCGGGGDSETSAPATEASHVSKAKFVKSAESVCVSHKKQRRAAAEEEYNKQVRAENGKVQPKELKQLAEQVLTESIIPSLRSQLEDLEGLGVPAADEAEIEKMLQSMSKGIDEFEEAGFAGITKNKFVQFEKEAAAYGVNCVVI